MKQQQCGNQFIHRPYQRSGTEIQCPACGWKQYIRADEDHLEVESAHKKQCRVRNWEDTRTYG